MSGYGKLPSILETVSGAAKGAAMGIPFGPAGIAAGAVISGIVNLFAGDAEEEAQMERIRKIQATLEEAKYDRFEMSEQTDRIGDYFNTDIIDKLNTDAVSLSLSGVINSDVVQAASMGKMLGVRGKTIADEYSKMYQFNKSIDMKKAEVETQFQPQNDLTNFISGGIAGLQTGLTVMDSFNASTERDKLYDILKNIYSG